MNTLLPSLLSLTVLVACLHGSPEKGTPSPTDADLLLADFEGEGYGDWKVTGTAFGDKPARGTLLGQMAVTGFRGKGLVNSFVGGDKATGTLTSPPFKIERDYLNFLIGGGMHPAETCMNLLVDDKVVRTATGPNDRPGGSEALDWASWDVKEFKGKQASLQIVDRHTGGWGHINIDHILQSDKRASSTAADRTREIVLARKYLLFPISNTVRPCRLKIVIEGKVIHDFDINLATDAPDWWAKLDLSRYTGKTATLTVDRLPFQSGGLVRVESSDRLRHTQPLYDETLRPQLRFSQMRGWNNDPNGLVYQDGEYHLFWQSNPFGPKWANMYWGHAVSKDLLHWQELPLALYPRTMAVGHCFSGSANVDENNTGGWQRGDDKVMVAAFTDTGAGEALAISTDRGRTWKYIKENPVIPQHGGRDPKLIWYEPGKHWVIAVFSTHQGKKGIAFYTSKNLKNWEFASWIEGFYECPELVELPVDNDPGKKRWVLFAADARYLIGTFDGKTFTPEHKEKYQLHYGSYYASQCFNRVPGGRVIQVGWARINMPGMPFNQAFSLPTELTLRTTPAGIRLGAEPIKELETLRGKAQSVDSKVVTPEKPIRVDAPGQLLDIVVELEPKGAREIKLQFGANQVSYNVSAGKLDGMPLPLVDGKLAFRVVVDRPLYEMVGGRGTVYKTNPRRDGGKQIDSVQLATVGGEAKLKRLEVYPMRSIWKK
jgi:fructan beta-fructosidase